MKGAAGQHLPLHGLLEHHRGRPGRPPRRCGPREQRRARGVEPSTGRASRGGQSIPRKEDRRLVQGQGVFVDDIKRHNMGYVHFVRSPYAHAGSSRSTFDAALEAPGVFGTLTGDEVAILTEPFFQIAPAPGGNIKDYALAVGRARFVGDPVAAVVAATRELARDAAELIEVEYDVLEPVVDARTRARPARAADPRGGRQQRELERRLRLGRRRRRVRRGRPRRLDRRAPLRPLQLDAARARRRARRVQPRHRAVDDLLQQPVPGLRGDHDGPGDRRRPRQAAHGHAGHRRRLRQQDHVAPAARGVLPAGAQARTGRCSGRRRAPTSTSRCRTATSAGSRTSRSRSRPTARCSASAARRSTTPARTCATSRSAARSGCRSRPGMYRWRNIRVEFSQVVTNKAPVLAEPRLLAHAAPLAHRAR